jgi:hypothetical protein
MKLALVTIVTAKLEPMRTFYQADCFAVTGGSNPPWGRLCSHHTPPPLNYINFVDK